MNSIQGQASSSSDGDLRSGPIDERKRKRMQSNRESARRSRMRKQKQLEDLTNEVGRLLVVNSQLAENIKTKEEQFVKMVSGTHILTAQALELADRLQFLNSILEKAKFVSGFSVDIPQIPDTLLEPWQVPYSTQPIMASSDVIII